MAERKENMKLWESVCESDPDSLKQVAQRGGFTAICAQHQLMRATEMWGPYGGKWGVKDLTWAEIYGSENGLPAEITLSATFWYPGGAFELATDIAWREGGECRKKALTDLRSKALSCLGFNADVFLGKFDGNRYDALHTKNTSDNPPDFYPGKGPRETSKGAVKHPSEKQRKRMWAICQEHGWSDDRAKEEIMRRFGRESSRDLTLEEYDILCGRSKKLPDGTWEQTEPGVFETAPPSTSGASLPSEQPYDDEEPSF